MKITDWCYVIFVITVSTCCVQADEHNNELTHKHSEKRITKRDAAIFIESFPIEPIYKHRPQVIYRRISSPRYTHPKPKYGPPRTKYRSTKPSRSPPKKHKKVKHPKYGPPKYKKRPPKPRYGPPKSMHKPIYGPPKSPKKKPVYGPPKEEQHNIYYPPEPVGFGEPPPDYIQDYKSPKLAYGEPPTDSYGAPLKFSSSDLYPSLKSYSDNQPASYDTHQDYNFDQEYKSWQNYQNHENADNNFAYSKKRPTYIKPDPEEVFEAISAPDEDFNLNPYSDAYKEPQRDHDFDPYESRRIPHRYSEGSKKPKKQWNVARATPEPSDDDDDDDQVIVGGKYAEPPGRYVSKFQPSAPMYSRDEDFAPKGFSDTDIATSATMSPYVNYKNSNIAFSPQNLNDAFSIVDK